MMRFPTFVLIPVFILGAVIQIGCDRVKKEPSGGPGGGQPGAAPGGTSTAGAKSLVEARKGFKTRLVRPAPAQEPVDEPPPKLFRTVKYDAPVGKLAAYLTPDPGDGKKHPAIVWITGGDCNSIGDVWTPAKPDNDQTAAAYRKAGIVMMVASLRGGNDNPGRREGFLGEVDDVLAAADFLARQAYVDPARIYLGGHSTGGTLALLVAECSDRFRAVFSFGPVEDVSGYGPDNVWTPFDFSNPRELELRSPGYWLGSIASPTFVFEGTAPPGNLSSLRAMARTSTNANVRFLAVRGANHFSLLAPVNRFVAQRVLKDDGPKCNLAFTEDEVNASLRK